MSTFKKNLKFNAFSQPLRPFLKSKNSNPFVLTWHGRRAPVSLLNNVRWVYDETSTTRAWWWYNVPRAGIGSSRPFFWHCYPRAHWPRFWMDFWRKYIIGMVYSLLAITGLPKIYERFRYYATDVVTTLGQVLTQLDNDGILGPWSSLSNWEVPKKICAIET